MEKYIQCQGKEISGKNTGEVKFRDVAACFSEEEWKLLPHWQKNFYRNVMKEIHQTLVLLGYQIVNPSILLRIYKVKEEYIQDTLDVERTDLHYPIEAFHPAVSPDILFRVTHEEESYYSNHQSTEEIGLSGRLSSCKPIVQGDFGDSFYSRDFSEMSRDLNQLCQEPSSHACAGWDNTQRHVPHQEIAMDDTKKDLCLRSEVKLPMRMMGHPDEGGESSTFQTIAEQVAIPDILVVKVKEEEEIDGGGHQDCDSQDSIPTPTEIDVIGKEFVDYETLDQFVASLGKQQNVVFLKKDCRTVETFNKRVAVDQRKYNMKFKYAYIKYVCKHFGDYKSKSTGIRPNQRTFKIGCNAKIYASVDRVKDVFVIKQAVLEHKHHGPMNFPEKSREKRSIRKRRNNTVR
ncbi:uncharacterized protein [Pleurodeles waltl]|uniref:uncharacterized protein isoform X1 n=1 Tax=Pleurodeles waltl TaxID=8319 RepID=UPI003709C2A9